MASDQARLPIASIQEEEKDVKLTVEFVYLIERKANRIDETH